jgi:hypothetical protein
MKTGEREASLHHEHPSWCTHATLPSQGQPMDSRRIDIVHSPNGRLRGLRTLPRSQCSPIGRFRAGPVAERHVLQAYFDVEMGRAMLRLDSPPSCGRGVCVYICRHDLLRARSHSHPSLARFVVPSATPLAARGGGDCEVRGSVPRRGSRPPPAPSSSNRRSALRRKDVLLPLLRLPKGAGCMVPQAWAS